MTPRLSVYEVTGSGASTLSSSLRPWLTTLSAGLVNCYLLILFLDNRRVLFSLGTLGGPLETVGCDWSGNLPAQLFDLLQLQGLLLKTSRPRSAACVSKVGVGNS